MLIRISSTMHSAIIRQFLEKLRSLPWSHILHPLVEIHLSDHSMNKSWSPSPKIQGNENIPMVPFYSALLAWISSISSNVSKRLSPSTPSSNPVDLLLLTKLVPPPPCQENQVGMHTKTKKNGTVFFTPGCLKDFFIERGKIRRESLANTFTLSLSRSTTPLCVKQDLNYRWEATPRSSNCLTTHVCKITRMNGNDLCLVASNLKIPLSRFSIKRTMSKESTTVTYFSGKRRVLLVLSFWILSHLLSHTKHYFASVSNKYLYTDVRLWAISLFSINTPVTFTRLKDSKTTLSPYTDISAGIGYLLGSINID